MKDNKCNIVIYSDWKAIIRSTGATIQLIKSDKCDIMICAKVDRLHRIAKKKLGLRSVAIPLNVGCHFTLKLRDSNSERKTTKNVSDLQFNLCPICVICVRKNKYNHC